MWDGLRHVAWGVSAGLAIVIAGGGLLSNHLYEVSARDSLAISFAAGVLFAGACVAALVRPRRAVRADPMIALRAEQARDRWRDACFVRG